MTFLDYLTLFRRRLPLVGLIVGVACLVSVGMTMRQDPLYETHVRLRARHIAPLSAANPFLENQGGLGINLDTEAQVIASDKVLSVVIERLGLQMSSGDLINSMEVFAVDGTSVLAIRTRAGTPQLAKDLANTIGDVYLELRREEAGQVADRAVEKAQTNLADAQQRLVEADRRLDAAAPESVGAAEAEAERSIALADLVGARSLLRDLADQTALDDGTGEVIQPADSTKLIRSTSLTRSLVFGGLLGIPLALAVILLLESMSETVRSAEDAEDITGADVIGLIPHDDQLATYGVPSNGKRCGRNGGRRHAPDSATLAVDADPFSLVSEAYRTASLNLQGIARDHGCSTVLVTSALAGEGKTTTVCNLAASTAERDCDVMLVDADLRRPSAHQHVGVDAAPGLAEVVSGQSTPRRAVQQLESHFSFVGSGAPVDRPDQSLTRVNLAQVLTKLQSASARRSRGGAKGTGTGNGTGNGSANGKRGATESLSLLDSAPILQAAESLALARAAEGVVLVVRAGVTRRQAAMRAVEQIHRAGGRLLGVLLVGVSREAHLGMSGSGSGSRDQRVVNLVREDSEVGAR